MLHKFNHGRQKVKIKENYNYYNAQDPHISDICPART
jgi:hypothetical protein